jgi:hypothetical protein
MVVHGIPSQGRAVQLGFPKDSRKLAFAKGNLIRALKKRRLTNVSILYHVFEEIRLDCFEEVDDKGEYTDADLETPEGLKLVRANRDFFWWGDQVADVVGKFVIGPIDWDDHNLDWLDSRLILKRQPSEWDLEAKKCNVADSEWMEAENIQLNVQELCDLFSLGRNRRGRPRHKGFKDVERYYRSHPNAPLTVNFIRKMDDWDKYPGECPSDTTIKRWIRQYKESKVLA